MNNSKTVVEYAEVEEVAVGQEAYYRLSKEVSPKKTGTILAIHPNGIFETQYCRYVPEHPSPQLPRSS